MAKAKKQEKPIEQRLEEALVLYEKTPYELPKNWCWVKLEDLTNITSGGTPARNNHRYWDNGQIHWVKISDLSGKYVETTEERITQLGLDNSSAKIFKKGTILYTIFATIGEVAILNIDAATNQAIAGITCKEPYNLDYMYYVLLLLKDLLVSKAKGVAQVNINQSILKETPIPLAPIEEQKRIVEIIEKQFAKLDEARDLIQKSLDSFADRKSAILHKAVTGELTEKWRVENRVSDEWKTVPFKEFCYLNRGFDLPIQNRVKGKVPLVASNGIIDYVDRANVIGPGVVTGRSGTIGKVFYIKEDYWPLNTALYSKDCCGNNAKYIYYYLSSFNFKQYSSSTAVPTLNRNNFFNVEVKVPSIKEQEEIVRILDSIFEKEDKSKELLDMLDKIDEMKKSILARAFRGQLGTFNPTDEPAIDLLRKILEQSN